jgi:hypothetical protein
MTRKPVYTRNTPNTSSSHQNCEISALPRKMNTARITSAPKMPQNSTRCWYFTGIANVANRIDHTNTLSTLSDFSIRYPLMYSPNAAAP